MHMAPGMTPSRRISHSAARAILLVVLGVLACSACAPAQGSDPSPARQGLYEECPPVEGSRCLERLTTMAAAGFDVVLNYSQWLGTAPEELAYAAQAQSDHLQLIWPMNDSAFRAGTPLTGVYPQLAATCACATNDDFIRYMVRLVKDLPATWGYYVGDEVLPRDRAGVQHLADLIRALDPRHPRLYVGSANTVAALDAQLTPFADTAEVLGADYYPVGQSLPLSEIGPIAHETQRIADQHGRQVALVLQSFSFAEYPSESAVCSPYPSCTRYPTAAEMRRMRDLVLANARPALVLWYSYFDIARSDDPAGHWTALLQAAGTTLRPPPSVSPSVSP